MRKSVLLWVGLGFAVLLFVLLKSPVPDSSGTKGPKDSGQVLEHFKLEGFEVTGEKTWELSGDLAHIASQRDVFMEKNVVLKIRANTVIRADKVFWKNDQSRFLTHDPVLILHEGHKIEGVGAVGRAGDEFLQINRKVRMSLEGPVLVTAYGPFQIYRGESRAVFLRDVQIRDLKGTIQADRLDVFFELRTGKMKQMHAKGNVRIERADGKSRSQEAIYNAQTQSVRLIGAPEIHLSESVVDQTKGP